MNVNCDVSSANCDILSSSPFILMHLMSPIYGIKIPRISAHIKNKYGMIGSPILHPLPGLKYSDTISFCIIHELIFFIKAVYPFLN